MCYSRAVGIDEVIMPDLVKASPFESLEPPSEVSRHAAIIAIELDCSFKLCSRGARSFPTEFSILTSVGDLPWKIFHSTRRDQVSPAVLQDLVGKSSRTVPSCDFP